MFYRKGKKAVKVCVSEKGFREKGGRNPGEKPEQLAFLLLEVLQAPKPP